jgi:hypothetical protein
MLRLLALHIDDDEARITELFNTLDQEKQREVAQQPYERAVVRSFCACMTPDSLRNAMKESRKRNEGRCGRRKKSKRFGFIT